MNNMTVTSALIFDKRILKICLIGLIMTPFCTGQQQGCSERNISCADVRIHDGFNFSHECSEGIDLSIEANIETNKTVNPTVIATAHLPSQSFNYSPDVLRMDNNSVVTKLCQDLKMKCTVPDGEKHVKEKCLDIKVTTGESESQDLTDPPKPWSYIGIGIGVGVIILIAVGFGIFCWVSWKKDVRRQQEGTAPSFPQYLLTCFGLRRGTFLGEGGERENNHREGFELQEVTTVGDAEPQQNGDVRNATHHDTDPRGSGEHEAGEENSLRNGHFHSIDSQADGKTPQSLGLNHNFWNETIQPTRKDDVSVPKANGESHHQALNRNVKDDDPGGANSNERKDTFRKMTSGCAVGDHNDEDHEAEGRPLLPNQRAAIQGFDMTGEATALVNKPSFDPDQVSGCSVAPETGVESTNDMKN